MTKKHEDRRSEETHVDSRFYVQLEKDEGASTRQMDGGKSSVAYASLTRHKSSPGLRNANVTFMEFPCVDQVLTQRGYLQQQLTIMLQFQCRFQLRVHSTPKSNNGTST